MPYDLPGFYDRQREDKRACVVIVLIGLAIAGLFLAVAL